jgi:hypothetical protein
MNWLVQEFDRARKRSARIPPAARPRYRSASLDTAEKQTTTDCPAVLMIKGVHYPCDWNLRNGTTSLHPGWAHTSVEAQAIWCGDEGASDVRGE